LQSGGEKSKRAGRYIKEPKKSGVPMPTVQVQLPKLIGKPRLGRGGRPLVKGQKELIQGSPGKDGAQTD